MLFWSSYLLAFFFFFFFLIDGIPFPKQEWVVFYKICPTASPISVRKTSQFPKGLLLFSKTMTGSKAKPSSSFRVLATPRLLTRKPTRGIQLSSFPAKGCESAPIGQKWATSEERRDFFPTAGKWIRLEQPGSERSSWQRGAEPRAAAVGGASEDTRLAGEGM